MPRKQSLPPELRALIDQAAALKRQQRTEAAPLRATRRQITASVISASKCLDRLQQKLIEWDATPLAQDCVHVADIGAAHFSQHHKDKGRAELLARIAEAAAELDRRTTTLALFDAIHMETL